MTLLLFGWTKYQCVIWFDKKRFRKVLRIWPAKFLSFYKSLIISLIRVVTKIVIWNSVTVMRWRKTYQRLCGISTSGLGVCRGGHLEDPGLTTSGPEVRGGGHEDPGLTFQKTRSNLIYLFTLIWICITNSLIYLR